MRQSELSNQLRREQLDAELEMSPGERLKRALDLGDLGVRLMQAGQGISRAEALRRIREQRQLGRRTSKANAP